MLKTEKEFKIGPVNIFPGINQRPNKMKFLDKINSE
jgi:hypothetical protein